MKKKANQALELISKAMGILEEVVQDAHDALEGRSKKWLESEAGEQAAAELETLEQVFQYLESADADLAGITEQ